MCARRLVALAALLALVVVVALPVGAFAQPKAKPLPEGAEKKTVTIYSDGTKMVGDLYLPQGMQKADKRPAVVFCAGTAGTRRGTPTQLAPYFLDAGFVFLAFDYRGWGDSDGKLVPVEPLPKPDAKSEVTAKVRVVRWQMDFADQTQDIRAAISFVAGEPGVDPERIGILGTSYGGGLVTWVAANDPRVKCVVAQVPGMGGGRGPAAEQRMYELATKQARGETEPVPFETGKPTGAMVRYEQMRYNPAKGIGFSPIEAAAKIKVPTLLVLAEKEELMDNKQNGAKVYEIIQAKKDIPVALYTIKGITHYGIYKEGFEEATKLELDWFGKHLKVAAAKPEK
jgi:dipeptidyl aminopeptidase/acylaminoacyl peptidase